MAILATYVSSDQFSVIGDQTNVFISDRRVRANCGIDDYQYGTITSAVYSGSTYVSLDMDESDLLTGNIINVQVGLFKSLPDHDHMSTEGDGGILTYTNQNSLDAALSNYTLTTSIDYSLSLKSNSSHLHDSYYYRQSSVDDLLTDYTLTTSIDYSLSLKSNSSHLHAIYTTQDSLDTALSNYTLTTSIDYSLSLKSNSSHLHAIYTTQDSLDTALNDYTLSGSLDYALSLKSNSNHLHDSYYYRQSSVDTALADYTLTTSIDYSLSLKSNSNHLHDSYYYRQSSVDDLLTDYTLTTSLTALLATKSDSSHLHSVYTTAGSLDTALNDYTLTTSIDYSLSLKSNSSHLHDSYYYRQDSVDYSLTLKSDSNHLHTGTYFIQNSGTYLTSKVNSLSTEVSSNTVHRTSTGADHSYINQSVTTTSQPTFAAVTLTDGTINTVFAPNTGDGVHYLVTTTAHGLSFGTNNDWDRMVIDSTGYVGINTVPEAGYYLKVDGAAKVNSNLDLGGDLIMTGDEIKRPADNGYLVVAGGTDSNNGGAMILYGDSHASPNLVTFWTAAGERMRIDASGNVGIGTTSDASAILQAQSTSKGFLPPVMTGDQAQAISSPATGLMIYASAAATSGNPNAAGWWGYSGADWVQLG